MGDLSGLSALVTGGSRGIGSAICRALAADGARVAVNYRTNEVSAKELVERIIVAGGEAVALRCDVSDPEAVRFLMTEIIAKFGGVDILVNNAGVTQTGLVRNLGTDVWSEVMRVNFGGVFNCTKAAMEHFESQRGGTIVNVSSVVAERGWIGTSVYAASKGAVSAFTRCCALEAAPFGVRVNAVLPGITATDLVDPIFEEATAKSIRRQIPGRRFATAEQVAEVVRFLASPRASYMNGSLVTVDGGISTALGIGRRR